MDEDRHEINCKTCGAELISRDLGETWICPKCNGISTSNIPIVEDCPMCGFPCHQEHPLEVVRCSSCGELAFRFQGEYRPGWGDEDEFICGDCLEDWKSKLTR